MTNNDYRIYFLDLENLSSDEPDGYTALIKAKAFSPDYGRIAVKEKHGSRWYTIAEAVNGEFTFRGKERDYYILPIDRYGQPSGQVNTKAMTKAEAILLKAAHGYVFDSYAAALHRADA